MLHQSPKRQHIITENSATDIVSSYCGGDINMKRVLLILLCVLLTISFCGCARKTAIKSTIDGNMKTYHEMMDGTWMCDNHLYKYRLEISGRMPNASVDSSFIYLSNIEQITFEQAYKASGVSSNTDDYYSSEEAVLVEMN